MFLKYSIVFVILIWMSISGREKKSLPLPVSKVSVANNAVINFEGDVKPIFEKHCNPCHFPGGKMYDKLPFDQASTIINHEEGILRRIKDAEEVKTIKQFVEENKTSQSHS